MSATVTGAAVGAVLALTWIVFSFWGAVLVAGAMLVGAVIGRIYDGKIDVRALTDVLKGRRSSS